MKAALLSAGPSLRRTFDPDERFDLRIGVNSAAAVHRCDWWSCGDGQTFERVTPIGFPVLYTLGPCDHRFRRKPDVAERLARHRVVAWSDIRDQVNPPHMWSDWSLTAAVPLAVSLGIRELHVFGHDGTGTVDVSGHRLDKRAENWRRVAVAWASVKSWAAVKGVKITEHREATICV